MICKESTIRKTYRLIVFLSLFLSLIFFNANVYSKSLEERANSFIVSLENANSKSDVIAAFKREGFKPTELKYLENELKRRGMFEKLSKLMGKVKIPKRKIAGKNLIKQRLKLLKEKLSKERSIRMKRNSLKVQAALKLARRELNPRALRGRNENHPLIESLSNDEISPGQTLVIRGRDFLNKKGSVKFYLGSKTVAGIIDEWHDSFIVTHIRWDFGGLGETRGFVRVTNRWAKFTEKQIVFIPDEEIITVEDKAYNLVLFDESVSMEMREFYCIPDNYNLLKKDTIVHNIVLLNGWKVIDYYLGPNIFPEAKYMVPPHSGSTHPRSVVSVKEWCILCSRPPRYVRTYLVIKGPRGLKPY